MWALITRCALGELSFEDFLDAAGLDEIRRPLNGILGSEGRGSGRIVDLGSSSNSDKFQPGIVTSRS